MFFALIKLSQETVPTPEFIFPLKSLLIVLNVNLTHIAQDGFKLPLSYKVIHILGINVDFFGVVIGVC